MDDLLFKFVAISHEKEDILTFSGLIIEQNHNVCYVLCPRRNKFVIVRVDNDYVDSNLKHYTAIEDISVVRQALKYIFTGEV